MTWSRFANWILDHARALLATILVGTVILGYFALQVQTDHTAGHFLASDSEVMQEFQRANQLFGQSQTILYLVFEEADPYRPATLRRLDGLTREVERYEGVEAVLSLTNVPGLFREGDRLVTRPLLPSALAADSLGPRLRAQPFLRGLLLSQDGTAPAMLVKIEQAFNDSPERVDLVGRIDRRAHEIMGEVALAGFPYLRTQYATRVTAEAPLFTALALGLSLLFLYLTFRAWLAVALPTLVVGLGIVWTIGLIALFGYRLNIVTAVLPALLVIIGMANAIHLSTKFFDRYHLVGDRRRAVVYTVRTAGMATFLTSLTTAIGFAVLLFSGSENLKTFGAFAATGILLLYAFSIVLIPVAYLHLKPPSERQARLATHDFFAAFFGRLADSVERHATAVLALAAVMVALGVVGALRISSDIYVFSDFYEDDPLRQDLATFERDFGGVLPMEVIIEADKPGAFRSLANLRRVERLQRTADTTAHVGRALSVVDLVKLTNQAYFGGDPRTYRLPSGYEMPFLQSALSELAEEGGGRLTESLPSFVDSTFSVTRVYLGVEDVGTARVSALADTMRARAEAIFPVDAFDVVVTGTAITATQSGVNLVKNLVVSLAVALVVISLLMALLFRSLRLTFISIVPNVIPLLVVGGAMGYAGILLKPSTALIFPLAFGIAVDDTIHFLAKYRLVRKTESRRDLAIIQTLRETGKAILFTSLVLMSGFLVFTFSSFAGTFNLGALTALTLAVALLTNLLLLPALLYRFGPDDAGDDADVGATQPDVRQEEPAPASSARTS